MVGYRFSPARAHALLQAMDMAREGPDQLEVCDQDGALSYHLEGRHFLVSPTGSAAEKEFSQVFTQANHHPLNREVGHILVGPEAIDALPKHPESEKAHHITAEIEAQHVMLYSGVSEHMGWAMRLNRQELQLYQWLLAEPDERDFLMDPLIEQAPDLVRRMLVEGLWTWRLDNPDPLKCFTTEQLSALLGRCPPEDREELIRAMGERHQYLKPREKGQQPAGGARRGR